MNICEKKKILLKNKIFRFCPKMYVWLKLFPLEKYLYIIFCSNTIVKMLDSLKKICSFRFVRLLNMFLFHWKTIVLSKFVLFFFLYFGFLFYVASFGKKKIFCSKVEKKSLLKQLCWWQWSGQKNLQQKSVQKKHRIRAVFLFVF